MGKNLDSSRKTRNNSTGTEHALKTGTIGQQSNNNQPTKEPTFPRTRRKNNISMKRKNRQHLAQKNGTCFIHLHRNTVPYCKKQANAWAGRVIFPFPFFVSRLSLFTFPRRTTKN